MTQLNALPVPAEIEAAVGRTITDLGAAFSGVLVNIGSVKERVTAVRASNPLAAPA